MMTKTKAQTCHLEISLRLMRNPPGFDNLHFYTNLIYSILQKVVIGIERTPGANRGICWHLLNMNTNLAESQIPPLRNSSFLSRFACRKDKKDGVVTPVGRVAK
jgi:hypothetical protein